MIRFTEKRYSFSKQDIGLAIAGTSLGISALNAGINFKHSRGSKKYQDDQLNAMNSLTKALTNVNTTIKTASTAPEVSNTPLRPVEKKKSGSFSLFNFNKYKRNNQ